MNGRFFHMPVLLEEVINGLKIVPGGRYIDATIGGGGHSWEIVKRGGILLGIDADADALSFSRRRLEEGSRKLKIPKNNWRLVQGNFKDIEKIARDAGFEKVNGILFDLGVSSFQLDNPQKGFSYRNLDIPIDLRFDASKGQKGADILNRTSENELYEIFAKYGEELQARELAQAIVKARGKDQIVTSGDLVSIIERVIFDKRRVPSVLSRLFQALRIVVNDELGALKKALIGANKLLISGARLEVISFHSLEDRIVKQFMKSNNFEIITKKPITASHKEVAINRRARSAKLRLAQKI